MTEPNEYILLHFWKAMLHLNTLVKWERGEATTAQVAATGAVLRDEIIQAIGDKRLGFEDEPEMQALLQLAAATNAVISEQEVSTHVQ